MGTARRIAAAGRGIRTRAAATAGHIIMGLADLLLLRIALAAPATVAAVAVAICLRHHLHLHLLHLQRLHLLLVVGLTSSWRPTQSQRLKKCIAGASTGYRAASKELSVLSSLGLVS